jgi:hypothetical protein
MSYPKEPLQLLSKPGRITSMWPCTAISPWFHVDLLSTYQRLGTRAGHASQRWRYIPKKGVEDSVRLRMVLQEVPWPRWPVNWGISLQVSSLNYFPKKIKLKFIPTKKSFNCLGINFVWTTKGKLDWQYKWGRESPVFNHRLRNFT